MEDFEIKLAEEAGLIYTGRDDEGEPMFLGTKQQWEKFEQLSETHE